MADSSIRFQFFSAVVLDHESNSHNSYISIGQQYFLKVMLARLLCTFHDIARISG